MSSVNAGPQYYAAQRKCSDAKTNSEKLEALTEMLRYAPKHKGAENLRREITRKIAAVKGAMEKQKALKKGSGVQLNVKKEGAGQVVLVGLPNSGKSTLLNNLTGLNVEVASYPFTTKKPEVGMMDYKGALVQVVEIPALVKGSSKGKADGIQLLSIVRNADAVVVVARDMEEEKTILEELENAKIKLNQERPKITIEKSKFRGITISGKQFLKIPEKELVLFLKGMGYHNASVVIGEEVKTIEKVVEAIDARAVYKPALVVNEFVEKDLEKYREKIFFLLDKIIIYTKKPGEKADMTGPLVLRKDSTIEDVAEQLHKDFAEKLRYVRVWGSSKFPGQRVSRDYKLKSGDIIEIYA